MKKILFILVAGLMSMTACQKQAVEETVYAVDEVFEKGDSLVNDTILVQGHCMHLCKHGGKKAFLGGAQQGQFLRANAVGFDAFAPESMNNDLRIKGVLCAMEIPAQVDSVKAEEAAHHGGEACETSALSSKLYYLNAIEYSIVEE